MLAERPSSFWLGQSTVAGQANLGLIVPSAGAVDKYWVISENPILRELNRCAGQAVW
jgi:hypothetical protein